MTAERSARPAATERWVLLSTILASSMAFIDMTALNVALPAIQRDLGIEGSQLLWIVNAYALFLSALILVGGSLGDHYGRKRIFRIGILIFSAASILCGVAPNVETLIGARALQGVGGALLVPGSLAIITASFDAARRGRAIGTWSTFTTLTTILGPVIGGWLAGQGLWRAVFFINVPLALIALAALIRVPESKDAHAPAQLDYPGALLATLGLAGLTYGFIEAANYGLGDPRIFLSLGGGVIAIALFMIVEARSAHPMVPLRLFRSRTFSGTNALTLFLYAALSGALFFLPLNLIQIQGYPEQVAGFANLPFAILLTLLSRWAGGLIDRVGARLPLIVGPLITGAGFFLFTLTGMTGGPDAYWTSYFPPLVVLGIGMGVTVAPLTTAVMGSAPEESSGTASGINNAIARTAGVLAVAILGGLALFSFTARLDERTSALEMPQEVRSQLQAQASNLAETAPPEALPPEMRAQVAEAIDLAFIDTFRLIFAIAAVLAWISAGLAATLVEARPAPERGATAGG